MKRCLATTLIAFAAFAFSGLAQPIEKARVVVLTDISNEPDDEESLVRYLVYANEFDTEGLVATTSTWLKKGPREDLIRRQLEAYALVRAKLSVHAPGYPTADELTAVVATGQVDYGLAAMGEGRATAGSRRIIEAADRDDPRPLWITVWGGANTLAQALRDVRATRSPVQVEQLVAKLRVYSISDQDDAGPWLRREFPTLFYVVSPSRADAQHYHAATWSGISGDRYYKNGPGYKFEMVEASWLREHVIENHGALGALYPVPAYIMEGDTPSFLGLVRNGLGWQESPAHGGWGGRYVLYAPLSETRKIWTNNQDSRDTVVVAEGRQETSDQATIWRWREHFQNDFAARMDWCTATAFSQANHHPVPAINGDRTGRVLQMEVSPGAEVELSAEGTTDPDGNRINVRWWLYQEAGTIRDAALTSTAGTVTRVLVPADAKPGTIHVIQEVEDEGSPRLFAYRRAILRVGKAL